MLFFVLEKKKEKWVELYILFIQKLVQDKIDGKKVESVGCKNLPRIVLYFPSYI